MKRFAGLLALLALAFPAGAQATTIMINGDTPAERWQREVDEAPVPTPDVTVAAYFDNEQVELLCGPDAAGCADRFLVAIAGRGREARAVFWHELGHVYEINHLSAEDLGRVAQATGLRRYDNGAPVTDFIESFADLYMGCSFVGTARQRTRYVHRYGASIGRFTPSAMRRGCAWLRARAAAPS